eukprot:gene12257-14987_t
MKHIRKMAMVVNQVKMEDEDQLDVLFWLSKSAAERLSEVTRLRKNYFTWVDAEKAMIFEQDFIDFIELLNLHHVDYMIVGAHALAYHGRPRHTGDLDIWIKPSHENASKMIAVLNDFGFGALGLSQQDFLKDNYVTQLGYPPLRIDILNAISGVEFDQAYKNKVEGEVDGLMVNFINVVEFIKNKEATGRKKDLGDVASLKKKML